MHNVSRGAGHHDVAQKQLPGTAISQKIAIDTSLIEVLVHQPLPGTCCHTRQAPSKSRAHDTSEAMQGVNRPKVAMLLRLGLFSVVLALGGCGAREFLRRNGLEGRSNAAANSLNVKVTADVSRTHPVAANLWGIFFEEVCPPWSDLSYLLMDGSWTLCRSNMMLVPLPSMAQ